MYITEKQSFSSEVKSVANIAAAPCRSHKAKLATHFFHGFIVAPYKVAHAVECGRMPFAH
jgi:hypothetical protein